MGCEAWPKDSDHLVYCWHTHWLIGHSYSVLERYLPDRVCHQFGERQGRVPDTYEACFGWATREVCVWGFQANIDTVVVEFTTLSPIGWGWPVGLADPITSLDYDEWWARRRLLRLTDPGGDPTLGRSSITGCHGE